MPESTSNPKTPMSATPPTARAEPSKAGSGTAKPSGSTTRSRKEPVDWASDVDLVVEDRAGDRVHEATVEEPERVDTPSPLNNKGEKGAGPSTTPAARARVPSLKVPESLCVNDGWAGLLTSTGLGRIASTQGTPAGTTPRGGGELIAPIDPPGTLGEPRAGGRSLVGPLSGAWALLPRREGSFKFDEMVTCGRHDARLVHTYTNTDSAWAEPARQRFLLLLYSRNAYFVPSSVACDCNFVKSPLDGLYLESMDAYLTGRSNVPSITDDRFWCYDLPVPSQAGQRTKYDVLRTQWTLSYGLGRVILFEMHDTFRADDSPDGTYDVFTSGGRKSRYRVPLERLPAMPRYLRDLRLPGGLCVRLPRVLRLLGAEVERPSRYSGYSERLAQVTRLECVHAVLCALQVDYRENGIVWVLTPEIIAFLREFQDAPGVLLSPRGSRLVFEPKGMIAFYEEASKLGEEFLFERRHVPTDELVRWAIIRGDTFLRTATYTDPTYGGRPVIRGRLPTTPLRSQPSGYVRGFGPERRSSGRTTSHGGLAALVPDHEVRGDALTGALLEGHAEREAGWTVRELVSLALTRVSEAERRVHSAEERTKDLEVRAKDATLRAEMWMEQCERISGVRSGRTREREELRFSGDREHRASNSVYRDPYESPAKRGRSTYDRAATPPREERRDGGAGPSAPRHLSDPYADTGAAPSSSRYDKYYR